MVLSAIPEISLSSSQSGLLDQIFRRELGSGSCVGIASRWLSHKIIGLIIIVILALLSTRLPSA